MKKGKPEWSDDFDKFSEEEMRKRERMREALGKEKYAECSNTELPGSPDGDWCRLTMDTIHQILMGLRRED